MSGPDQVGVVCQVSTWDVPCGIAAFTAGLLGALEAGGVSTAVLPIDRVALEDLSKRELGARFEELGRQAGQHRVVHIHHEFGFFAGAYGLPESMANLRRFVCAARRGAERIVITFHSLPPVAGWPGGGLGTAARQHLLAQLWRRCVVGLVDGRQVRAVAPSRYQRRLLIDSGVSAAAITVLPQGAPAFRPDVLAVDRAEARERVGIPDDAHVVLQFGFVATYKGHLVSLDALRALPPDHHLLVVGGPHPHGSDPAHEQLLAAAHGKHRLAGRVHVTGWVPDHELPTWFAAGDVCVVPYLDAGLVTSAAAVWALASGRPVIASRIPAFRELATTWDCVELVPPRSPHQLADAVRRLATDEDRAKQLVLNGAATCEAWAWPVVAAAHRQLYA